MQRNDDRLTRAGHDGRLHQPEARVTSQRRYRPTSIEFTAPLVDLTDPQPVVARRETRRLLAHGGLSPDAEEGLVGAVSEVVTNAALYGRPPIRMLGWLTPEGAVLTVTDGGEGPDDPEAGRRPEARDPGEGGLGLWLAHQLCSEVVFGRHDDGFTVRLVGRG